MKNLFLMIVLLSLTPFESSGSSNEKKPNIIIIYTDDLGYNDLACYGSEKLKTPNIDKLASEGIRFTDFYVAQPVCSASRASLLTGCYPNRVGISGALSPTSQIGLNTSEITLAEVCKSVGYKTAIIGKWHLGHQAQFLPTKQGFDEYFGLPYSNDMWPKHPTAKFPRLPLMRGDSIAEYLDNDQNMLTTWYTNEAVNFIKKNKKKPFFLYFAHNMPHVPLYVNDKTRGKSEAGLYGDVISEIDESVGHIMKTLKSLKIDKNTLIIFASDNGPWLSYGEHAGSAAPLREGKLSVLEGGVRVPCIMRLPGQIPAGAVQHTPAMTIDILPTVANLIGAELPEKEIDGKDIWPLIKNEPEAKSPHDAYFFYFNQNELLAVRMGPWKLYFPHTYNSFAGKTGKNDGQPVPYEKVAMKLELYNLQKDIGEKENVAEKNPQVVLEMINHADAMRAQLGDKLKGVEGTENRAPGKI